MTPSADPRDVAAAEAITECGSRGLLLCRSTCRPLADEIAAALTAARAEGRAQGLEDASVAFAKERREMADVYEMLAQQRDEAVRALQQRKETEQ